MKINYIAIALLSGFDVAANAAVTTQVNLATNGVVLKNNGGVALSAGTSAGGDGTILQVGYYTSSTISDPFSGNWVAMTGPGTTSQTTIGDFNQPVGSFKLAVIFTAGALGFTAPADGTPLALRFYDSSSLATVTFFNAVSNTGGEFNWVTPTDPTSNISLSLTTPGIVWQDGSGSAFKTTIAVPEPSSVALIALLGVGTLAVRRRTN